MKCNGAWTELWEIRYRQELAYRLSILVVCSGANPFTVPLLKRFQLPQIRSLIEGSQPSEAETSDDNMCNLYNQKLVEEYKSNCCWRLWKVSLIVVINLNRYVMIFTMLVLNGWRSQLDLDVDPSKARPKPSLKGCNDDNCPEKLNPISSFNHSGKYYSDWKFVVSFFTFFLCLGAHEPNQASMSAKFFREASFGDVTNKVLESQNHAVLCSLLQRRHHE